MKPPLPFYFYQIPFTQRLKDSIRLAGLRICLFFLITSLRHPGIAIAIALLLFLTATSAQPLVTHPLQVSSMAGFGCRVLSILLGLMWMSLIVCRWLIQITQPQTWRQDLQHSEANLRYQISVLEDWLVLPTYTTQLQPSEVVKVRYHHPKKV
jgi:hypothetical protein